MVTIIDVNVVKKETSYGVSVFTMQPNEPVIEYAYYYYANGKPLIGKDGTGAVFHMTGTSSSFGWAEKDSKNSNFYINQINEMLKEWEFGIISLKEKQGA